MVLLASQAALGVQATPERDLLALELEDLMAIEIGPSADASARGLTPLLPGGQVADGGRAGFLGTRANRDTPLSLTSYSNAFIHHQQAASVGDVLQYDPAVRVTRGFGNFQQTYLIRGLPLFSDDMAYNGLYGILPRQYLAAQLIERVEVLRGSGTVLFGVAPGSALGSGLGGAVNVVPKRAGKMAITDLSLGYQRDGQTLLAADVGRRSDDQRWGCRQRHRPALDVRQGSGSVRHPAGRVRLQRSAHRLDCGRHPPGRGAEQRQCIPHGVRRQR
jgi:iron complex outermembrane receptor protein